MKSKEMTCMSIFTKIKINMTLTVTQTIQRFMAKQTKWKSVK